MVLATVGLCGTGKSEATRFLAQQLEADIVYFGQIPRDEIRLRGIEQTPDNERLVREELRQKHGMDVMARRGLGPIQDALAAGRNVVIDGLYSHAEYEFLSQELSGRLMVVALHTVRAIRCERLRNRPERPFLPHEIDQRDLDEIRKLDKAGPIVLADHHVLNNSSLEALHGNLDEVIANIRHSHIT